MKNFTIIQEWHTNQFDWLLEKTKPYLLKRSRRTSIFTRIKIGCYSRESTQWEHFYGQ